MWMGSPILAAFESASGRIGKSFPGIFRRARSRPGILPSGSSPTESGGLYFFTSARTRVPLERTTKIPGSSLTFVEGRTLSRPCRLTRSSAAGCSPGAIPIRLRMAGTQADSMARLANELTIQRGGVWAGWMTWPFVMRNPRASMNHPVPVSLKGGGVCWVSPLPQFRRTSATTSATIRATAGLARRIASWTVSVRSAPASPAQMRTRLNARPVVARMRERDRLIVGILYLLGGEKKKAPGEPPGALCNRGNLLLLQDRHGGLGLLGRLGHVARLARRFGFVHEDPSLVSARGLDHRAARGSSARSLNILTARGLHILAARSLDILSLPSARSLNILTARGLHILPARSLNILTARGLHILAARSLHILTAGRLNVLPARSLDILAAGRLHILAAGSLNVLAPGASERPGRLHILALGDLLA